MGFELITVRYSGIVLTYIGFRKSVHRPLGVKNKMMMVVIVMMMMMMMMMINFNYLYMVKIFV